jgi:3-polyprenyl-4-hydroxybenzoate decarboxylase
MSNDVEKILVIPCSQRRLEEIKGALQRTDLTASERQQLLEAETLIEGVRQSVKQRA